MPAQTNATITQNMSDRQPNINSMILSMIFINKSHTDIFTFISVWQIPKMLKGSYQTSSFFA